MSEPSTQQRPAVLTAAKLPPFYLEPLQAAFTVHERLHETDPVAFARIAPTIRGITGGGESMVPRALMDQLPALDGTPVQHALLEHALADQATLLDADVRQPALALDPEEPLAEPVAPTSIHE